MEHQHRVVRLGAAAVHLKHLENRRVQLGEDIADGDLQLEPPWLKEGPAPEGKREDEGTVGDQHHPAKELLHSCADFSHGWCV